MAVEGAVFWGSTLMASTAALMVVTARHPVRAVLCLVLTFVCTAVSWLLLEAEFLAIALVLVYVGAVMVLFLFVVMMLDIELEPLKQAFSRYLPLGTVVAGSLISFLFLALVLPGIEKGTVVPLVHQGPNYSNVKALGEVLYTDYLFAFELAGVILLVAMIASILLTFRGIQGAHKQSISRQVQVKREQRVQLVDINIRSKPDASS